MYVNKYVSFPFRGKLLPLEFSLLFPQNSRVISEISSEEFYDAQ